MSSDQKYTVILHLLANLVKIHKNTKLGRAVIPLNKYMMGKYYQWKGIIHSVGVYLPTTDTFVIRNKSDLKSEASKQALIFRRIS